MKNLYFTLFSDASTLPTAFALVVELGPANLTHLVDQDGLDVGGIYGEQPFHTYAVGNLTNGEGGGKAGALAFDDVSFEALDTFFIAFDDLIIDGNVVPGFKLRELLFGGQLLVDKCYGVHDTKI
jgi:hypothetical protein